MLEHINESCDCQGKLCTKCQHTLCVGRYTKDKRLRSGLKSQCRICVSAENKKWRKANHEHNYQRKKIWTEANIERVKTTRRQRYKMTADRVRALARRRRYNNYERIRAQERAYDKMHRERKQRYREREEIQQKERAAWKNYYWQNRERMNERVRKWQQANPEKHVITQALRRTRKTQAGGSYTLDEWELLRAKYNYACLKCGKREPEIKLTADHVMPVSKLGSSNIDNIQPLCRSCNSAKGDRYIDFRTQNP